MVGMNESSLQLPYVLTVQLPAGKKNMMQAPELPALGFGTSYTELLHGFWGYSIGTKLLKLLHFPKVEKLPSNVSEASCQ